MGGGSDKTTDTSASSSSSSSESGSTQKDAAKEAPKQEEPAIQITADALLSEYKNNELAADQKYKGKVLQVSGSVDAVSDTLGSKQLSVTNGDEYTLEFVYCRLTKESLEKAATLNKGGNVTVQGKNDGYSIGSVSLKNCTIVG